MGPSAVRHELRCRNGSCPDFNKVLVVVTGTHGNVALTTRCTKCGWRVRSDG